MNTVQQERSKPIIHGGCRGEVMRHTLSLFVANKPGVLIRIALVFARRGYNIDSLVVKESEDPRYSTMTIVVAGDEYCLDQILKQLNKLVNVLQATDQTESDLPETEPTEDRGTYVEKPF